MRLKYLSFKYHITVIKALIICTKYLNINKLVSVWALLGLTGPYWALLGCLSRPCWALLGLARPYWTLLGLTLHLSN